MTALVRFWAEGNPWDMDVVDAHGDRWVLASQVGEALGVSNVRSLVADLRDTEGLVEGKHYCRLDLPMNGKDVLFCRATRQQVEKSVQDRERLLLSYRGVIRVAMRSDGPRAVQFRDWAEDVLFAAMVDGGIRPALGAGADLEVLYRKGASMVKSAMMAGKALGVPARDLRRAAVAQVERETGVSFAGLLPAAEDGPAMSDGGVAEFLGECCTVGRGFSVAPVALYDAYLGWCGGYGHEPMSRNGFYKAVTACEPTVRRSQIGPDRTRVFVGVALSGDGEVSA